MRYLTEINFTFSPQLKAKRESEVSDLPPVIKISKAEIHSKVMSWPTSHPFARKVSFILSLMIAEWILPITLYPLGLRDVS